MIQTHKWLNIFILSGEEKLHRGFYENQYINKLARIQMQRCKVMIIPCKAQNADINRARCTVKLKLDLA
jgi:hypothetical protein